MKTFKLTTLAVSLSAAILASPAHAVLERVGPTVQANGYPAWYQDTTGLSLEFCSPLNQAELDGGYCLLLPGNVAAVPEVFPGNFFDEHFYWAAGALMTTAGSAKASLTLGLEGAFGGTGAVVSGGQVTFTRIRVVLTPVQVTGVYRFIHPYGEESLDGSAGGRIFFTDDVGIGAPGDFVGAMHGRLGPFLLAADLPGGPELPAIAGPAGKSYIADPARLGPVTGSPLPDFLGSDGLMHNHNVFRIEGPVGSNLGGPGIDFIETTDFNLMGRAFTGSMPSLVIADRASYSLSTTEQKVDVYATAFPTAASRLPATARPAGVAPVVSFFDASCQVNLDAAGNFVSYSQPTGAPTEILMNAQGDLRYGQVRPAGAAMPDAVCVKDNSATDINGQQVPVYHPLPVNDEVRVTEGTYDPVTQTLVVSANSSDLVNLPVLTLSNYGTTLTSGTVTVSGVMAPPSKVSVLSSKRGQGEYLVASVAAPVLPDTVFASSDVATTLEEAAVVVPVINGDLRNGVQIDPVATPITLAVIVGGSKGSVVVNNLTGSITYTPKLNATGVDSFSYTVTVNGVTSNIATVTVNITPVNDAPVGVADTAVGPRNTALSINVLGNDTDVDGDILSLQAGSLAKVSGPAGSTWSIGANANGTVAFTANTAGQYRFTYQATDGQATTAATGVTVNVSAPDTITVGTGDYTTKTNRWKVSGTTSVATAHNMVVKLTGVVGNTPCNADGRVLATIPSVGTSYAFDFIGTGQLDPRTTNCNRIRVDSELGGASLNFTYRLK
jgi:hypothetical protein